MTPRFYEAIQQNSKVSNREWLKRWAVNKIKIQRDILAEREFKSKIHFLGGLQDVCFKAGKSNNWVFHKFYSLAKQISSQQ